VLSTLFVLLVALSPQSGQAQVWNGSSFGDWFVASNWIGGAPTSTSPSALIDRGFAVVGPSSSTAFAVPLTVGGSFTGQLAGVGVSNNRLLTFGLTVGRDTGANGLITVGSGGTLSATSSEYVTIGERGNGMVTVSETGNVVTSGPVIVGKSAGSFGAITMNGGLWRGSDTFDLAAAGNGALTLTNRASMHFDGDRLVIGRQGGRGTVSVTGSSELWATSWEVQTPSMLTVGNLGRIGGSTIDFGAGQWLIDAHGAVSAGTATFRDATLLRFTLEESGYGLLDTGMLTLDGMLRVDLGGGFSPTAGDRFDLLRWTSLSGRFDAVQLPALAPTLAWDTSMLYVNGEIAVVAVPEPSTAVLFMLGLGGLTLMIRRRRLTGAV